MVLIIIKNIKIKTRGLISLTQDPSVRPSIHPHQSVAFKIDTSADAQTTTLLPTLQTQKEKETVVYRHINMRITFIKYYYKNIN